MTSFWFEDPSLAKPIKEDAGPNVDPRLWPRECREMVSGEKGRGGKDGEDGGPLCLGLLPQPLVCGLVLPLFSLSPTMRGPLHPLLSAAHPPCLIIFLLLQGLTYKGPFSVKLCWSSDDGTSGSIVKRCELAASQINWHAYHPYKYSTHTSHTCIPHMYCRLGSLPIMTRSTACHLNGLGRSQLLAAKV